MSDFSELIGKTLISVKTIEREFDGEQIVFTCDDGSVYRMYHKQDCCEHVTIDDVNGDLDNLVGSPILGASEDSNSEESDSDESSTWTFYNIYNKDEHVSIKWYGSSNGYYSEGVSFIKDRNE